MPQFFIETLGCKVNQYESSAIADLLKSEGFEMSDSFEQADILIINTCTVTNRTDFKSRNLIRRALKFKEKDASRIVVVTGCYVQREKDEALSLGDIDLIVDNNHKNSIGEAIRELLSLREDHYPLKWFEETKDFSAFTEIPSVSMGERSRAFIKIQDGCDFYCAYCAVPSARGKPRSRDPQNIINQVRHMSDQGYKEFVLAGINLGLYGREFQDYQLSHLLEDLCRLPKVEKIRISSVEPQLFTDELIRVIAENSKICNHLHIPLQTGSDTLLKKMGRRYTTTQFKELIFKLVKIRPDLALGFDVIVGLPGESNDLFNETKTLLESLPFTYLHVFVYSKRTGTPASTMSEQVHGSISKERSQILLDLSKEKHDHYKQRIIDQKVLLDVIVETMEGDLVSGTSDHFTKVWFKNSGFEKGDLIRVIPVSNYQEGLWAEYDPI